jgi:hypothetical protein
MEKVEAVRLALAERGDLPCEELAAFVQARFGVKVEPRLLPVIKAMLRDREALAAARRGRASAGP